MALILAVAVGLGALIVGAADAGVLSGCCCCCGCCLFAAVRFFDDGMFAGDVGVKNSCGCIVESKNAGDAICSGSGLGFDSKRLRTR